MTRVGAEPGDEAGAMMGSEARQEASALKASWGAAGALGTEAAHVWEGREPW